jgi:hypothetical protein
VNSTLVGGGVAEMLTRLMPCCANWSRQPPGTLDGGPDFFEDQGAHNALHAVLA